MSKLVTIDSFTDQLQAHLLKGRLEAEGIPAVVSQEHHISVNWLVSQALGGVKVQVPEPFVPAAKEVLVALKAGEYALSPEEYGGEKCPKCSSHDVDQYKKRWNISFLSFFFLQIPLPFSSKNMRCLACGHIGHENEF